MNELELFSAVSGAVALDGVTPSIESTCPCGTRIISRAQLPRPTCCGRPLRQRYTTEPAPPSLLYRDQIAAGETVRAPAEVPCAICGEPIPAGAQAKQRAGVQLWAHLACTQPRHEQHAWHRVQAEAMAQQPARRASSRIKSCWICKESIEPGQLFRARTAKSKKRAHAECVALALEVA